MSGYCISHRNINVAILAQVSGRKITFTMNNAYDLNQGEFCFVIMKAMAIQAIERGYPHLDITDVVNRLESVGWRHSLTTYRQKRKHLYEVLRRNFHAGLTTLGVYKGKIVFDVRTVNED